MKGWVFFWAQRLKDKPVALLGVSLKWFAYLCGPEREEEVEGRMDVVLADAVSEAKGPEFLGQMSITKTVGGRGVWRFRWTGCTAQSGCTGRVLWDMPDGLRPRRNVRRSLSRSSYRNREVIWAATLEALGRRNKLVPMRAKRGDPNLKPAFRRFVRMRSLGCKMRGRRIASSSTTCGLAARTPSPRTLEDFVTTW